MSGKHLVPATERAQKSDLWMYLLGAVLVYSLVYPFMKKVIEGAEAQASLIATALTLLAVYTGTYIWKIINANKSKVPALWLILFICVMVCLVAWLFLFGQFPMFRKNSLNLLFFGFPLLVASLLLGLIMQLSRSGIERNLREAKASATHSMAELSVLQSQLSPHFLFNTLNNLYGISITQHEKLPALLLKLSELLRYSVYETRDKYVPLQNEIAYLNNYIEFERLSLGERLQLKTAIEQISDQLLMIAPMIFIVFVENAFKHAKNTSDEKVYIDLELRTWGNNILFSIRNSGSTMPHPDERSGGMGLVNVRKRLELIYPGRYDLHIDVKENEFKVMLQVIAR